MKLFLVRHGEAEKEDLWDGPDETRPLTEEGAQKIGQIALGLRRLGIQPESFWSSPLTRAYQTAELICRELGGGELNETDVLRPGFDPKTTAEFIQEDESRVIMLIAHSPDLERLTQYLIRQGTGGAVIFNKGTVALLRVARPLRQGAGELQRLWTPKSLIQIANQ